MQSSCSLPYEEARPTPPPLASREIQALQFFLVAAFAIWIPVHLALPICRDQAIIGVVAERILQGFWPYADTWDHKGPVAYLLYLPFLAALRDVQTAVNLGDVLFHGIAYLSLRAIGRSLGYPRLAGIGLVALVLIVRNDHWTYGQPETWLAMIWLGVLALLIDPRWHHAYRTHAAAGAVVGLAVMFKPVLGMLALLPLAILLHDRRDVAMWPRLLALTGTALAVCFATVMPFWLGGRLPALVDAFVVFNIASHVGLAGDDSVTAIVRFVVMSFMPWFDPGAAVVSAAAILGLLTLRRRSPRAAKILGVAWLVGLLCVVAQGKSFHYHFAYAHVAASPFAAIGVITFLGHIAAATGWRRRFLVLTGLAATFIAVQLHAERAVTWWGSTFGRLPASAWEESFCSKDYCPSDIRDAGDFVRRTTAPGTEIFHFGFDAAMYLAADRPPVSRYIFSYPLIAQVPSRLAAARDELMATLAARPPVIIVVQDRDTVRLLGERSSAAHLPEFEALAHMLSTRYERVHVAGRFAVHRLSR